MMNINYVEMKSSGIYDYVAQNYWRMSKEQLANICKELSYAVYTECGQSVSDACDCAAVNALIDIEITEQMEE